jgi:hypothetical protein
MGLAVIIQSRLANGDDFGMPRQLAQPWTRILRRFQDMIRMPSDRRIHIGKLFRDLNGAPTPGQIRADGDYFCNPVFLGAPDNIRQIRLKIGKPEVRVSIVKNRHETTTKAESRKQKAEMEAQKRFDEDSQLRPNQFAGRWNFSHEYGFCFE